MARYKLAFLSVVVIACSAFASAISVRVTSPTNGSTVSSPVRLSATASSPYTITGWRVYVDSQTAYSAGATTSIGTSLAMTSGKHKIVVRAWNRLGHSASATVYVTVLSASVSVTVSPTSATVQTGQMKQFTATVTGTTNAAVQWLVNGLLGGDSASGTVSSSGLYTAPAAVPSTAVTITARSSVTSASANAIVTVVKTATSGTDYYVSTTGSDSNDGSASAPWHTISHSASFVKPGDTIHVAPGTYPESVILSIAGGTSSAHIRYISDVKWAAKITGGGSDRAAFRVQSGPYVDIIGFEVTNKTGTQGIEMYASGGRILGNLVHNVGGSSAGGAGIHTYPQSTVDVQIIGNVVHDIGNYLNPNNWQVTHGIYIESTRADVENNLVYRNEAWGIHMFHTPYGDTVTNNTVFENGWGGIIVSGSSSEYAGGSGMDDYTTVSNNIIMNNGWHGGTGRGGILEEGSTGPHNVYYNNLLSNNRFQGSTGSQINIQTGTASGNIGAVNPQFVNYQPDGSGDYHLSSSSPAIDAGTAAGAVSEFAGPPKLDMQGGSRPLGANYDIGAYEYQSGAAIWPWY